MQIHIQTLVKGRYDEVFKAFDENLFKALKPPLLDLKIQRFDGSHRGGEIHLEIGFLGLSKKWVSVITDEYYGEDENYFIDEGLVLPSPLKSWKHSHIVRKIDNENCYIIDQIEFSSGNKILDFFIYPGLYIQFLLRRPVYKKFFTALMMNREE